MALYSRRLSTVLPLSKVEPELIYSILKLILEAVSMRYVPFTVDYLERHVFIGRTGMESQNRELFVVLWNGYSVSRRGSLVYQVRIEDLEKQSMKMLNDENRIELH